MKPTVEQMHEHVMAFCRKRDIIVTWCDRPTRSRALPEAEEIRIAKIKSEISYAVALHEIGHILGRHQRSKRTMVLERWAWQWARKNALIWTDQMARHAHESLEWYRPRAKMFDARRAKIDASDAENPTKQGLLMSEDEYDWGNPLTVGEMRAAISGLDDDIEIDFGCTLAGKSLVFYRWKWRDDKLLQIELNEEE